MNLEDLTIRVLLLPFRNLLPSKLKVLSCPEPTAISTLELLRTYRRCVSYSSERPHSLLKSVEVTFTRESPINIWVMEMSLNNWSNKRGSKKHA